MVIIFFIYLLPMYIGIVIAIILLVAWYAPSYDEIEE
jgi:hypothetical protein